MNRPRIAVSVFLVACAATLAFAAGAPGEWPFTSLPPETVVYIEMPAPGETSQAVDHYAGDVIGVPIPNLLQMGLSSVLGTNSVSGLDMARPISAFVTQPPDSPGAPDLFVVFPITGKDAFLENLKDPGTGQSRATEADGVCTIEDGRSPSGRIAFAFTDRFVVVTEKPAAAKSAAAYFADGKPIHQRGANLAGDVLIHVPMERLDKTYRNHIEAGISEMQSAMMQEMQNAAMPGAQEQMTAIVDAEVDAALQLMRQISGMVVAVDIMGSDVGLTKRVTPKAGSAFADFIAKNSGMGDLPYKNAIPPDAPIALSMQINPESYKAMMEWFDKEIMAELPGFTAEQRAQWKEMMDKFVPMFTGKVMAAYTLPEDGSGPLVGMHISEVVGVTDSAEALTLVDKYTESLIETTNAMSGMPGMNMTVKPLPGQDNMRSYQIVMSASGDPQMQDMMKAMYGDGFAVHLLSLPQAMLVTTDTALGKQMASRVGQTGAAAIHPMESRLPADKMFAMRMSLPAIVRVGMVMAAKATAATGDPDAMPPPPQALTPGILMGAGCDGGDFVSQMLVPGAEVKAMKQMITQMMQQQEMAPEEAPDER